MNYYYLLFLVVSHDCDGKPTVVFWVCDQLFQPVPHQMSRLRTAQATQDDFDVHISVTGNLSPCHQAKKCSNLSWCGDSELIECHLCMQIHNKQKMSPDD